MVLPFIPDAPAAADSKSATYAESAAKKEEAGSVPYRPLMEVAEPTQVPGSCGSGIAPKQRTDQDKFFETLAGALGGGFGSAIPALLGVQNKDGIALSSGVGAAASVSAHHLIYRSPSYVILEAAAVAFTGAWVGSQFTDWVNRRYAAGAKAEAKGEKSQSVGGKSPFYVLGNAAGAAASAATFTGVKNSFRSLGNQIFIP